MTATHGGVRMAGLEDLQVCVPVCVCAIFKAQNLSELQNGANET